MKSKKIKPSQEVNNQTNTTSSSTADFPNLIPLMAQEYRRSAMNTLKNWFVDMLLECIKTEREFCKANKIDPLMTQDKINKIQSILDKCQDVYELQALSNYVFIENVVPENYEEVKTRGFGLRLLYPMFDERRGK